MLIGESCVEFVSIMHTYHKYSQIMHKQSCTGNTIIHQQGDESMAFLCCVLILTLTA